MKLNVFNSLIGLCVATAAVSCSDALVDDVNNRPVGGEESDMISFVVANNNTTRGGSFGNRPCGGAFLRTSDGADSLYMKAEVADMDALSTRADYDKDNLPVTLSMTCRTRKTGTPYFHYFENETFTLTDGVWASETPHWWLKESEHYNFFGFAPADAKGVANYNGHGDTSLIPSIEYTVPAAIADQRDLMYHDAGYINSSDEFVAHQHINTGNTAAPVNLKHVLSKVAFKIGDIPEGNITNITLENVRAKGTLDLGTGQWSDVTTGTYSINKFVEGNAKPISGEDCLMVIPGMNADNANIVVEFNGKKYEYPLKGYEWQVAQSYTYTINIAPDFTITIDDGSQIVDAHYVIAMATVHAEANVKWDVEVSAVDQNGNKVDVTVVRKGNPLYESYEDRYKEGYWLDKVAYNGVKSEESARGKSIDTGTGSNDLYIFIPQNTTDYDRTIEIKNQKSGEVLNTIIQRHPAWSTDNTIGWEQIEDDEAQWGFFFNEKHVYVYNDGNWAIGDGADNLTAIENMIKELINQFNASSYVTYKQYWEIIKKRYYVAIDYGAFNNLQVTENKITKNLSVSSNNGFQNTSELNGFAGSAYSTDFEDALNGCVRVEDNTTKAFVRRRSTDPSSVPTEVTSSEATDPMLPHILKKNKYSINKFTDEKTGLTTEAALFFKEDLEWYLPAYEEFNKAPTSVDTKINPASSWSSTAVANSTEAYLGSGKTDKRNQKHAIRVCYKR